MSPFAFTAFLRWWLGVLVNARLRPMFCRWKDAERAGNSARAERFEHLFLVLLNYTDCYPFSVDVGQTLWITDEPIEDYYGTEDMA